MRVEGIGAKIAGEILKFDVDRNAEREFRLAEKISARVLTLNCAEYPELLKTIYDPPPVIYVKGKDLRSFPVPIAVVGTRAATNYGKLVAEKLCSGLATLGVCVVSGMARGIDTIRSPGGA